MPKPPTIRLELREFLASMPQPVRTPIPELFGAWIAWRRSQDLPGGSVHVRAFRGILSRMEELGELTVARTPEGKIVEMTVTTPPPPGELDRMRALERERAIIHGRFYEASAASGKDLFGMRTPALNAYVRQRRTVEEARRSFSASGMDPAQITFTPDPLAEEALALKERVLRLEVELLAWRELGRERDLAPALPIEPVALAEASAGPAAREAPATAAKRARRPAAVSRA
jgi:hypothetical protein